MIRKFKKALITGITGSGGSYLAEHLLKKNIKVYGFYRSKGNLNLLKSNNRNKIIFHKIDLCNYNLLRKKLLQIRPDVIFHIASDADVKKSFEYPIQNAYNNNTITINLLEAIRKSKAKVDPVIMICSTSEVYGNVSKKELPIKETQQIAPINPYAVTKTFQDLISQVYNKSFGLKIIITRMFSYTNARRNNLFQTAFANQIIKIQLGKQKFLSHGNLNSLRTFVDIEDAMEAYWLAATKGKIGEIYNIGGDDIISVKNYLKELISLSSKKIMCKLDKKLLRPTDILVQIPDSTKFRKHTGWKPTVSFTESIKKFYTECKKNVR